ncbi:MAG TPA: hypothetical protein VNJ52_05885 [Patescibacteria group bacterium]|nr:hypothetical protein [Patescibacteria group bacterium]
MRRSSEFLPVTGAAAGLPRRQRRRALGLALFAAIPLGNFPARAQPRPTAMRLRFLAQPANTAVGAPGKRTVRVAVLAADGKVATSAVANVSLSLATNPGGGATLSGILSRPAVKGIATFAGLSLDTPGRGYTLRATANIAGAVLSATSRPFNAYIGTAISIQFQPATIFFGDSASFVVSISPCQSDFGGTAGKIQMWLARETLATIPVGQIGAGCQARVSVRFASPRFPAATYPLTVVFFSSNPNYDSSKVVRQISLAPLQITAAYAGDSLVAATGPKTPVSLRAKISTIASRAGPASASSPSFGIFDRVNGGASRVRVDFFNCSATPCQPMGTAPVRDAAGAAGTGIATLAEKLPVGVFALTFRVRQAANFFAAGDLPAGQQIVETGESAVAVTPQGGAGLRGAGWTSDAGSSSGKCWFAFSIRRNRGQALAGSLVAVYPDVFEGVPADFVIRSESPERLKFLDRTRNEAELTARAGVSIINRASGEVVGGFAAPATPNLTMVVVGGKAPQFGLKVLDASGATFATVGTSIGKSLVPFPAAGGRILLPTRP